MDTRLTKGRLVMLILCVNLTAPWIAWIFSQTLFWVCLTKVLSDEINIRIGRLSNVDCLH